MHSHTYLPHITCGSLTSPPLLEASCSLVYLLQTTPPTQSQPPLVFANMSATLIDKMTAKGSGEQAGKCHCTLELSWSRCLHSSPTNGELQLIACSSRLSQRHIDPALAEHLCSWWPDDQGDRRADVQDNATWAVEITPLHQDRPWHCAHASQWRPGLQDRNGRHQD